MQYWNTTNKLIAITLLCVINFSTLLAQENSPYSRYALGNLKLIENAAQRGMAGVSIADDNILIANPTNPATYASLKMTSFQIGIEAYSIKLKSASDANRTGSLSLAYMNIGIPITKKIGVCFGLLPQTRSRYNMEKLDTILGSVERLNNFYGGGGTQRLFIGAAYKVNDFSFGFNTGYTFGNIVNSTESQFPDSLKILSNSITSRTTIGGVYWQLGALMNKKLKDEYSLKLGVSYTGTQNLKAKKDTYWKSFIGDVTTPDYSYKVDSAIEYKGHITNPSILSLGAMLTNGDYWQIGIDVNSSNWEKYKSYDNADSTSKSYSIKIGGAITPDVNSVNQTWKKITYRAGLFAGQDILKLRETTLKTAGLTVGIGYPIRRTNLSIGQINAALEVGKRGTTDNGLLHEGYTRFVLGFTFNDKWFIKRKYD